MNTFRLALLGQAQAVSSSDARMITVPPEDRPDCWKYVSTNPGVTNDDCYLTCAETEDCTVQPDEPVDCYGNWMYGYDEEYGFLDDYENRWENDFHWTVEMGQGSRPQDCQTMCQQDDGCGFFAYRASGDYGDSKGVPLCVMKKLSSVMKANNKHIDPASVVGPAPANDPDWAFCNLELAYDCYEPEVKECKFCLTMYHGIDNLSWGFFHGQTDSDMVERDEAICAWKSEFHISGPKFCNHDIWIELDDSCDIENVDPTDPVDPSTDAPPTAQPTTTAMEIDTGATDTLPTQGPDGTTERPETLPLTVTTTMGIDDMPLTVTTTMGVDDMPLTVTTTQGIDDMPLTVTTTMGIDDMPLTVTTTQGIDDMPLTVTTTMGIDDMPLTVTTTMGIDDMPLTVTTTMGIDDMPITVTMPPTESSPIIGIVTTFPCDPVPATYPDGSVQTITWDQFATTTKDPSDCDCDCDGCDCCDEAHKAVEKAEEAEDAVEKLSDTLNKFGNIIDGIPGNPNNLRTH